MLNIRYNVPAQKGNPLAKMGNSMYIISGGLTNSYQKFRAIKRITCQAPAAKDQQPISSWTTVKQLKQKKANSQDQTINI
jgi:hypothetical protein